MRLGVDLDVTGFSDTRLEEFLGEFNQTMVDPSSGMRGSDPFAYASGSAGT
jgi:hypothetical protein